MSGLVTALDHVVLAVADVDAAATAYEALLGRQAAYTGQRITWKRHPLRP